MSGLARPEILATTEWLAEHVGRPGVRILDARWRPLLGQVRDDRTLGWDPTDRPRPGSADGARALAAYAVEWAAQRWPR